MENNLLKGYNGGQCYITIFWVSEIYDPSSASDSTSRCCYNPDLMQVYQLNFMGADSHFWACCNCLLWQKTLKGIALSSFSTTFFLIGLHTHPFRTYDCFLIGAQTTNGTLREHLCWCLSYSLKAKWWVGAFRRNCRLSTRSKQCVNKFFNFNYQDIKARVGRIVRFHVALATFAHSFQPMKMFYVD